MEKSMEDFEVERKEICRRIEGLGDFRPGLISVNFRKCGKKNCACAKKSHPGHGPQYLWNATRKGKSMAQNLRLGPELEKVQREVETYRHFVRLSQELIELNEKICRLRPVSEVEDEKDLSALKKKLQRKFALRRRKRSKV